MKHFIAILAPCLVLTACSYTPISPPTAKAAQCLGNAHPPKALANYFREITRPQLLHAALGKPFKGGLCQGKVYRTLKPMTIYRAWNSTNSDSKLGAWWAFEQPRGEILKYHFDYQICYQWSPLDKLLKCTLRAGTIVAIGTGQSVNCSKYLKYPTSAYKQLYLDTTGLHLTPKERHHALYNCSEATANFKWKHHQ